MNLGDVMALFITIGVIRMCYLQTKMDEELRKAGVYLPMDRPKKKFKLPKWFTDWLSKIGPLWH